MTTRFGQLPSKKVLLVERTPAVYCVPDPGFAYNYFVAVDNTIIALDDDVVPFGAGSLIVLRRWHKDVDGDWVWRLCEESA